MAKRAKPSGAKQTTKRAAGTAVSKAPARKKTASGAGKTSQLKKVAAAAIGAAAVAAAGVVIQRMNASDAKPAAKRAAASKAVAKTKSTKKK